MRPPSCEEAAWRLFGISMAGYNALISLALALLSLRAAAASKPAAAHG
jgi:disulfide bond formation protein DsbB